MKYEGNIYYDLEGYFAPMRDCNLVVFCDLFTPLRPVSLFVSCQGFSKGQAESGLVPQDKEIT